MAKDSAKKIHRKFTGTVVSSKGDKTLAVKVSRMRLHPKYLKRFIISKQYLVHDEKNEYQAGDNVTFIECRPISRRKCWRVLSKAEE